MVNPLLPAATRGSNRRRRRSAEIFIFILAVGPSALLAAAATLL